MKTVNMILGTTLTLLSTATHARENPGSQENLEQRPAIAPGGRWVATIDRQTGIGGLLIQDQLTEAVYRIPYFSGAGIIDAHWITSSSLEVDLNNRSTLLEIKVESAVAGATRPTFRVVTTKFNDQGISRIDYLSPPLTTLVETSHATHPFKDASNKAEENKPAVPGLR